jgi:hypothetical protein
VVPENNVSEAIIWKHADGTLAIDWPENARTVPMTRQLLEAIVADLNERADLRAALDSFLILDSETFKSSEELLVAWRSACDHARGILEGTKP